jgi:hypothetical protein
LWRRRFTIALRRNLAKKLKSQGVSPSSVRVSFVKVVEMQACAIRISTPSSVSTPPLHLATIMFTVPPPQVMMGRTVTTPTTLGSRRSPPPSWPPSSNK